MSDLADRLKEHFEIVLMEWYDTETEALCADTFAHISALEAENSRLRALVQTAFDEGRSEGGLEQTSMTGGKWWDESNARAALEGKA